MILVTHAIVGAGVAQLFPNHPILGFTAGVASHYLSDMVPHWDYGKYFSSIKEKNNGSLTVLDRVVIGPKFFLEASIVVLDTLLGFILAWFFWHSSLFANTSLVILGATAGMSPDYLQILYGFWQNKITASLQKFHSFTHCPDKFKINNIFAGVGAQIIFLFILVSLIKMVG